MKHFPIRVTPDFRITGLPAGSVALTPNEALRLADEVTYRALLAKMTEQKARQAAARARRLKVG